MDTCGHERTGFDTVLGSYEPERMAFARRLVATTDLVFTVATSRAAWDRFIRLEIVLLLLPFAFTSRLASIREKAASSSALNFDTTY